MHFSFPLERYDAHEPLVVEYVLKPANGANTPGRFVWQDGGWKE